MKKITFYVLAIVVVIALFIELWSLVISVIALMAAFFVVWIQNGHHRFLEIKDKFLFFNEMVVSDSTILSSSFDNYREVARGIEDRHSMSAILLKKNYEQYLKEDWLYHYRPSKDVLQLLISNTTQKMIVRYDP